jgi:hypothetical protein
MSLIGISITRVSGDHCVVPLVQLSRYFLSSLELIDPLGELQHPLFGNGCGNSATFVHMSTTQEVDLYLIESWNFMRDVADLETHAWMDQQRTNFMLLRSSMQRLLPRYRFMTTHICWEPLQYPGGFSPTLTPLMYEK